MSIENEFPENENNGNKARTMVGFRHERLPTQQTELRGVYSRPAFLGNVSSFSNQHFSGIHQFVPSASIHNQSGQWDILNVINYLAAYFRLDF